jgi:hypothetical protein
LRYEPAWVCETRDAITKSSGMKKQAMDAAELVGRVRGMFLEVPGTRLSVVQAARLAGVETSICRHILESLTQIDFLKMGRNETFMLR